MSALVVVSGTGTEIGKTHVTEALTRCAVASGTTTAAWKPIESGVPTDLPAAASTPRTDFDRLRDASSFHVQHHLRPAYRFAPPVSPHLAARRAGVELDLGEIVAATRALGGALGDGALLFVELAGGLLSPLGPNLLNLDLALALAPDVLLLVAPDRLGVLHDALATVAATPVARRKVLVLSRPERPDASTGTNAAELRLYLPRFAGGAEADPVPVHELPRASVETLAAEPVSRDILSTLLRISRSRSSAAPA